MVSSKGTKKRGRQTRRRTTTDANNSEKWHGVLHRAYYDPRHPAGYGGVERLYLTVGKKNSITRRQVKEWLSSQDTYTLHKPVRRRFRKSRVISEGIDFQWQADLADLPSLTKYNGGYRYILTCIDVFSKHAWAIPIKNKKGVTLVEAFQLILDDGRKPWRLQTDQGKEFLNRNFQTLLKDEDIEFFTTFNEETKASVVERFNRTLKTRMWKFFTASNTYRYVDVLNDLVWAYNNSYHRSIKMSPLEVNKSNQRLVWHTLYGTKKTIKSVSFKFKLGDQVRISKSKLKMEKGYTPNWSTEIFTVSKRIARQPPVYRVQDYNGDELQGTFYEQELQKVSKTDDVFLVEKIIQTRKRGGITQHLVQWKGYPKSFNSWVSEEDMTAV